jgi:CubicO group peptidase (beta-lactamase class C family)
MRLLNRAWLSLRLFCSLALFFLLPPLATAQSASTLPPNVAASVDDIVRKVLASTGVPSASLAIVKDGKIAYAQAYGDARLEPELAAKPDMQYSVGSISKQFTAAAVLLLQEQGKLSLNDPVSKYVSGLTRGDEVTIRELLSHTSGYQDYWPQDYVMPMMLQPTTAQQIIDQWAKKPLDFDPGTKYQYSNTNYVIAGVIVEKVAGMPLLQLLHQRVFDPLGMKSIANVDEAKLPVTDPEGYLRYALGPLRPAPKEGKGWIFAAGELAMTAQDLARWDISMIQQTVLKPASYAEMEHEIVLKNGVGTRYGLGVEVRSVDGHRVLSHSGEVSGFTAENMVLPDDGIAIVVQTNQDAVGASGEIANQVRAALLKNEDPEDQKQREIARQIYDGLQQGKIDRSLFTDNCNAYFSEQALKDYGDSLGPLGKPESFSQTGTGLRGGMTFRVFDVRYPTKKLEIITYQLADGKFEQFLVTPSE